MTTFLSISGILMGTKDWPVKPEDRQFSYGGAYVHAIETYPRELAAAKSRLLPVVEEQREMLMKLLFEEDARMEYSAIAAFLNKLPEGKAYHLDVETTEINTCELNCTEPKYCSCCMGKGHRALRITTPKAETTNQKEE